MDSDSYNLENIYPIVQKDSNKKWRDIKKWLFLAAYCLFSFILEMVLGTLLIICFMFIFGHIEKAFIVLWILLAFIIIQIPIFGIYFILKKKQGH